MLAWHLQLSVHKEKILSRTEDLGQPARLMEMLMDQWVDYARRHQRFERNNPRQSWETPHPTRPQAFVKKKCNGVMAGKDSFTSVLFDLARSSLLVLFWNIFLHFLGKVSTQSAFSWGENPALSTFTP